METKEFTCIGCPLGCTVSVEMNGTEITSVTGNTCKKGDSYVRKEVTNPTRMFTSSVKVEGGIRPVVPVKTTEEVPKNRMFECAALLRDFSVKAPVASGQILVQNFGGFGVDLIATDAD